MSESSSERSAPERTAGSSGASCAGPAVGAPVLAVGAVVLRAAEVPEVCLIRRGHPPGKGRWSLPGGRVEPGERLQEALQRELLEETGLAVRVGPLIGPFEIIGEDSHYVVLDYLCEVTAGEPRAGDDAQEVVMAPVDSIPRYRLSAAVVAMIADGMRLWAEQLAAQAG